MSKKIYKLIDGYVGWKIFVCILQGRFNKFQKAVDYLNVRLNRKIYQQQLKMWELDRKIRSMKNEIKNKKAEMRNV